MADSDVIDEIEDETGTHYKRTKSLGLLSISATVSPDNEYNQLLEKQRDLEGFRPAIRDRKTGYVYSHPWSHGDVPRAAPDDLTFARLAVELKNGTNNVGFIGRDGKFLSREEAWNKYGFCMRESLDDLKDDLRSTIRRFHGGSIRRFSMERPLEEFYGGKSNIIPFEWMNPITHKLEVEGYEVVRFGKFMKFVSREGNDVFLEPTTGYWFFAAEDKDLAQLMAKKIDQAWRDAYHKKQEEIVKHLPKERVPVPVRHGSLCIFRIADNWPDGTARPFKNLDISLVVKNPSMEQFKTDPIFKYGVRWVTLNGNIYAAGGFTPHNRILKAAGATPDQLQNGVGGRISTWEIENLSPMKVRLFMKHNTEAVGLAREREGSFHAAFFPSTDKMWQNPISGNFEIFLVNPSKGKIRISLTHTHKLRWLMFEGKSFYTNAKHLTHFQMAEMIGEPNPTYGIGGFMTQQMFGKIPADMDMRLWEQENATAVR